MLFVVVFSAVFVALWFDRVFLGDRPSQSEQPRTSQVNPAFDFTEAADRVMASVVSIDTSIKQASFMGETQLIAAGSGSGVVFQADGYIVTNAHVVRDPSSRGSVKPVDVVTVRTNSDQGYDAKVVGIDEVSDLAVIKIENASLAPATFGDSDSIQVGDWVMAVGNQLGFDNSVSVGVVSSKNRWLETPDDSILIDAIQTDAAINRGNSGGALCNTYGDVIGINSSIATYGGVSSGVGFAIPSSHVKRVVKEIIENGFVEYAVLGIEPAAPTFSLAIPQDRKSLSLVADVPEPPNYGLLVMTTYPGLPAAQVGIKQYDVILEINGKRVYSNLDYIRAIMEKQPGDKVEIKVWSKGKTKTVTATLTGRAQLQRVMGAPGLGSHIP